MIPVTQTLFGDGEDGSRPGNCLQACIASIFELPLDDVPHFVEFKSQWYDKFNAFLAEHDLWPIELSCDHHLPTDSYFKDAGYYLAGGKSPRGIMHSVVYHNGELAHDPHPKGGGLVEFVDITVFVKRFEKQEVPWTTNS